MDALQQRIAARIAEAAPCLEGTPGVTIILNIHTASVVWMNGAGLRWLEVSLEDLIAIGPDYHARFFNLEEADSYVPKMLDLVRRNDPAETVTIFQQVRTGPAGPDGQRAFQWYASGVRIFLHGDDGAPLLVIATALPIDEEHYFTPKINRLLAENDLLRQQQQLFAGLSRREREVLGMMVRDVPSPEIAARLFLSEETVKTHRRNIRRKLGLSTGYDLVLFAQAFDVV